MTQRNVFAHTQNDPVDGYVPFVSLNAQADGTYQLTVRGSGAQTSTITLTKEVVIEMGLTSLAEVADLSAEATSMLKAAEAVGKTLNTQLGEFEKFLNNIVK